MKEEIFQQDLFGQEINVKDIKIPAKEEIINWDILEYIEDEIVWDYDRWQPDCSFEDFDESAKKDWMSHYKKNHTLDGFEYSGRHWNRIKNK